MIREKFINLLKKQPVYNQDVEASKINIHLPIYGDIYNYVIKSNQQIKEVTNSEIDFSLNSFQIPHITLAMGFVHSLEDYAKLCGKLENFANQLPEINLTFTKPYVKKPKENYVFIDVNPIDKIIELKKELNSLIKSDFESVKWDILNEPPHITIGYIKTKQETISKNFDEISKISMPINKINLSFTGNRGSVIGIIKEFNNNKT